MDSIDEKKASESVPPMICYRCCKYGKNFSQCCQGIILFPFAQFHNDTEIYIPGFPPLTFMAHGIEFLPSKHCLSSV